MSVNPSPPCTLPLLFSQSQNTLTGDYDRLPRREAKDKSHLFREMLRVYQEQKAEEEFLELQQYGAKLARGRGIFTEEAVEKLVFRNG